MADPAFIAFDLDNTLLDPDMRAYRETVYAVLKSANVGLASEDAFVAFESLRAAGHALERLGLQNPIHDRGCPHGLAAFWLLHCANDAQRQALGISSDNQPLWKESLSRLVGMDKQARKGSCNSRLDAERRLRAFRNADDGIDRFRDEVIRLAGHPTVVAASQCYKVIESSRPVESRVELMEKMVKRGFAPVIITEGRTAVQMEKVARCGLDGSWSDRVLITEEAAGVQGLAQFEEMLSQHLEGESIDFAVPPSHELSYLWYFHCLIDAWAHKTPCFFARCLHAIQGAPEAPRTALLPPRCVKESDWKPLRFVVVGDRHDKDIEPVIDLLGPGAGVTVRLRTGKYGHLHGEDSLAPDCRPDRTFTDWGLLATFLQNDLTIETVPPIMYAPLVVDRDLITLPLIEFGQQSGLEAVRVVAELLESEMEQQ